MVNANVAAHFRTPTGGKRAKLVIGDRVMVEMPTNKNVMVALTYIYGIGKALAKEVINNANISGQKKARDLSEQEIKLISEEIKKFLVEGQLREKIKRDISKQVRIGTYRGLRLSREPCPLPLKQSTRHNGRTAHKKLSNKKGLGKVKKIKKVPEGRGAINGYFSFNNTILNLSKENGEVLTQCSAGSIGYRGTKKSTAYVAQKVAEELIRRSSEYGVYSVKLQVKGIGAGRDPVIKKIFEAKSLNVEELVDNTPIPFNGTQIEEITVKDHPNTASFVFRHLPVTMGVTIGNYLRRLLISCVSGIAPVGVVISDKNGSVQHKFVTLEGVVEDGAQLVSNLKQIILEEKKSKEGIFCLELRVENKTKEERVVTANDFLKIKETQIKNPELYLATVSPGGILEIKLYCRKDQGYHEAKNQVKYDGYEGDQVNFEVNETVIGLTKVEEELKMTVVTNGAVKPSNALLEVLQVPQSLYDKLRNKIAGKDIAWRKHVLDNLVADAILYEKVQTSLPMAKNLTKLLAKLIGQEKKIVSLDLKAGEIVNIYLCGPTVYDHVHLGNLRPVIVFDVLYRILLFLKIKVNYVQNITNIDDKIIAKARKERKTEKEISEHYTKAYLNNLIRYNIIFPAHLPRVTDYIPQIQNFISSLEKSNSVYQRGGEIFFHVGENQEYGKLSGQNLTKLKKGMREIRHDNKEDYRDFML
ncbi:1064_t:CDS:2 [Ambispora leptoticha]|uniref:1064_t:CDS:1 n=1 Tax=Ambispora leptoticha TaxID=144679 RepID=A0A9N8YYD5_9GLOM|nr:1064_t:CDS:2 [Ambispora leptoticha]